MSRLGAPPEAWRHLIELGWTEDLLPAVADPEAPIAAGSSLERAQLGKIPSRYNAHGEVIGFTGWSTHKANVRMVESWAALGTYNACMNARTVHAFDLDVEDEALLFKCLEALWSIAPNGGFWDPRGREGSPRVLLPFYMSGEPFKKRALGLGGENRIELLGVGQQWVAAGTHPSGAPYQWERGGPGPQAVPTLSESTVEAVWETWRAHEAEPPEGPDGRKQTGEGRNVALARAAYHLRKSGTEDLEDALHAKNEALPQPLSKEEVHIIAAGVERRVEAGNDGHAEASDFEDPGPGTSWRPPGGQAPAQEDPKRPSSNWAQDAVVIEHKSAASRLVAVWAPPEVVSYGEDFDDSKIPPRDWLLGNRRSVGEVTIDVGPPGTNKSMLLLTDAVAIATGRELLKDRVHRTGTVLYLAGEDARRDVESRLAAILRHHQIDPRELAHRLKVVYRLSMNQPQRYTLARMERDVGMLNEEMVRWLRQYPNASAIFLDPVISWSQLMEDSNEAMALLTGALKNIAAQQRHVGFDHHINKMSMIDPEAHVGNLSSVRGGGALIGDVRWGFTMAKLRPETAASFGIPPEHFKRYRRLDPLKTSYDEDDAATRLLKVETQTVGNGERVGLLTEVDMTQVRQGAAERQALLQRGWSEAFAQALLSMLKERSPRSLRDAGTYLASFHPELFTSKRKPFNPLSGSAIRGQLEKLIGPGLTVGDSTIVTGPGERKGDRAVLLKPLA